jgi:hypothetical protein
MLQILLEAEELPSLVAAPRPRTPRKSQRKSFATESIKVAKPVAL